MSLLASLAEHAQRLLGRVPPGNADDAVITGRLDRMDFQDVLGEVPALAQMVEALPARHAGDLVRDVWNSFYQSNPKVRPRTDMDDERLANWSVANSINESPETAEMRSYTEHEPYGATMATLGVTTVVQQLLEQAKLDDKADTARQAQAKADAAEAALQQALNEATAEGAPQDAAETVLQQAIAACENAQQAADQAAGDLQGAAQTLSTQMQGPIRSSVRHTAGELGREQEMFRAWGVSDGEASLMSFEQRRAYAALFNRSAVTRYIDLVGRFKWQERSLRAKRVKHGRDEVWGVTRNSRLEDVYASQFALLGHPVTEMEFMARYAEGQLLSRQYRGSEKAGKGAMIVIVDTSDSMNWQKPGQPVTPAVWSKGLMLSLLERAKADKRDFVGMIFASRNQVQTWRFPKGRGAIEDVVEMVSKSFNGGTDFQAPLDAAVDILTDQHESAQIREGDIVFITDDDCAVGDEWLAQYRERKAKLGFRVWGIAVPKPHAGSTLQVLSDNARGVTDFTTPNAVADLMQAV